MSDSLVFRMAAPTDDGQILELFKESFGRELAASWWRWFSYQCPTGANRTSVIVDTATGKFAGSYSLLPIRLLFNGREVKASLCTNVNTHPEYQGRGLFTRIGSYALERECEFDTAISLGMPNQKAYPGHVKVGWDVMSKLPFLVRQGCQARRHRCRETQTFDQRFDAFFAKIAERFSFLVLKDHKFMNWRVAERPDREYVSLVYEEGSELKGYVVLKHFDDGACRKSHILDIQAETDEALHELILAAETFAQCRDELSMWTNPHNPYRQGFLEHGFYERESQDLLIIHFNCGQKEYLNETAWWFCLADNDVY